MAELTLPNIWHWAFNQSFRGRDAGISTFIIEWMGCSLVRDFKKETGANIYLNKNYAK